MFSSSSSSFSPDHHHHHQQFLPPNSDQLCYVHCKCCDTVLAVSVPCTSLFKTVTVRCGHCTNLLSVNMRGLLLPTPADSLFCPQNLLEEIRNSQSNMFDQLASPNEAIMPVPRLVDDLPKPPLANNRATEKRQRVPSAYNRFIKEEIQRIKAENPDINHREAFSAAAKNWAHFPHIQFGFMPDQPVKKSIACQQEGEDLLMKDGFFAAANQMGVFPY